MKTSWFELCEAHLPLTPYSRPTLEMAAAAKNRPMFMGSVVQAIGNEIQKHAQEQTATRDGKSD